MLIGCSLMLRFHCYLPLCTPALAVLFLIVSLQTFTPRVCYPFQHVFLFSFCLVYKSKVLDVVFSASFLQLVAVSNPSDQTVVSGFGFSYQQLSSSRKNVSIIVSVLAVSSLRAYSIQVFIHTVFCSFNPYLPRRMTFTYSASSSVRILDLPINCFPFCFFFRLVCGV